jgi:hypothetical protein
VKEAIVWLEGILSREDLLSIIAGLAPVTIQLGEPSAEGQAVHITEVAGVSLVGGEGLRVTCRAWIELPSLGVTGRISIDPLTLMLKPSISRTSTGPALIFTPEVEHADVLRLPGAIDEVTETINRALSERHIGLSWRFAQELDDAVSRPSILGPLAPLNAHVSGGRVWVTEEALVVAISFQPLQRSEGGLRFKRASTSLAGATGA